MSFKNKICAIWRDSLADKAALWRGGLHGFERETFRLDALSGLPSTITHEQLFAKSAQEQQLQRFCGNEQARLRELLPQALTLDFSDQEIELVSPPHSDIASAEADITLLLRFVASELHQQKNNQISDGAPSAMPNTRQGEMLWAFSQPPLFRAEDLAAVRIADFGEAEDAEYKEQYRKQLLLRYGKAKQSWTGIHYNFSLDPALFEDLDTCACETYLYLSRNLWRNFWLLELLFGCSPHVSEYYASQVQKHFAKGGVSLALPPRYAGSLHSHFGYGYRSSEQQLQYLDYSSPCAYWQSIERIARTESPFFRRLGLDVASLIQDSRELYSPFRLKQLHTHGNECWEKEQCLVDYLELRIFDIDPFYGPQQLSGIYLPSIYLAHLLLLHSVLIESPPLERAELLRCAEHEQYILSQSLKLELPNSYHQKAEDLLVELGELAVILDFPPEYLGAVVSSQTALKNRRNRAQIYIETFGSSENHEALLEHSRAWTKQLQDQNGSRTQ